ncbi:partial phosphomannomutase, partial [Anaerolineae bacterium]
HRYVDFFGDVSLEGTRLLVYQHSAVGRDLLVEILRRLGAEAIPAGRSETFIPIDTENMDEAQLQAIQALYDESTAVHGPFDAIVSTDGDSDRPLILGVEAGKVRFFGGDLVGMVTAEYLGADAIAVPISCNDAIDRGALKDIVCPKTQIGSPFVIARMEQALAQGKQAVCGFEANGGFLTGSPITRRAKTLAPLPTRDALLPMLAVLYAAKEQGLSLSQLFDRLPKRYSRPALIKQFPRPVSLKMVGRYSPADGRISEAVFTPDKVLLLDSEGKALEGLDAEVKAVQTIAQELSGFFTAESGFGTIAKLNYVDGVRIYFDNGEVAHLRPSGNADELRIYAVSDSQERSDAIARLAIAEPDGILRRMERRVIG